jgi:DNA-directed RNA polymerase subunit M/transcription elongation factor TFIIS
MTAVKWLFNMLWKTPQYETEWQKLLEQAKQMEKEQSKKDYKSGVIDGFNSRTLHMGAKTNAEQYYNDTYGSKGSDECYFEQTTNTSSATICKHCGREKFMHTELQQINQDNPVTRGSTALVPTSSQTEISDEGAYYSGYAKGYNVASSELFKELSDEEIQKYAQQNAFNYYEFIQGAKWYREQLKQRQ